MSKAIIDNLKLSDLLTIQFALDKYITSLNYYLNHKSEINLSFLSDLNNSRLSYSEKLQIELRNTKIVYGKIQDKILSI